MQIIVVITNNVSFMAVDYLSALNQSGSGLNITQIVDSLVEAETSPAKERVNKKIEESNASISAFGELTSDLNTLKNSLKTFKNKTTLTTSSTSTAANLTINSPSIAKSFSSDINISSLATAQTLEFTGFTLPTSNTGSGSIVIEFGQWLSGATTDADSLYSQKSVTSGNSLGTPTSHTSLKGTISITSEGGDLSSTNFTVTGTDMAGNTITEIITGPTFGNSTTGSKVFKTVTNVVPDTTVAGGSVTVGHSAATFGLNYEKTTRAITIPSGATLNTVANSLDALSGVSANIINKGDGTYSLLVRSDTGLNNALRLTVTETSGDAGLSAFDNSSSNTQQATAASDALFTVDGVNVSRSSNTVDDLFDGFTLNLSSTTTSAFRVKSTLDKNTSLETLREFVNSINTTRDKINELTSNEINSEKGPLYNNVVVSTIKNKINKILTGPIKGFGSADKYLAEIGVSTNQDGTLQLNEQTFNSKFDENTSVFNAIFNSMFDSTSPYLKVESSIGTSKPIPGSYSYITSTTEKTLSSSATPSSNQTLVVNNNTDIEVGDFVIGSGIPSGTTVTSIVGTTITLSSRLNNSITSGSTVKFTTGSLDGTSLSSITDSEGNSYFVTSGNAPNTSGIKITESQSVSAATIFYGRSLVQELDEFLESSLKSSGLINSGKLEINSKLNEFNLDLADIDERVSMLTERYKTQFTAMEQAVTSLKSTGDYMENLLNAWNKDD